MAIPLSADRLVSALRAEGCTVHEVPGWRDHNRNHRGAWGPVHGVMVHHTVTGPGTDVVGLIYNGHSVLPGPLATGCITKDGVVHLTANGRANHAGGGDGAVLQAVIDESYGDRPPAPQKHDGSPGAVDGNARFYGWECENEGDGRDPWPRVQYDAIVRATAAICRAHGWGPKSGIGHLEWSDWKPDPRGFAMKDFRAAVAERLAHEPGWNPGEEDDVALTDADIEKIARKVLTLDGVIVNAVNDPNNTHIALASSARNIETIVRRVEAKVIGLGAPTVSDAQVTALAAAIAADSALADRIAEKVAVKLAARLAN
ncbi:N-acetylmuramoyl-L-alanine amidase [Streptomyces sp. NPDC059696]|uniref:N-acetylmuramoyl-L-alanine amidase n=1 Tax=Streptomyces sp. NPDC059696 TaxID=3346911 RepID=UPI0036C4CD1B